jgi:hypothetical protein
MMAALQRSLFRRMADQGMMVTTWHVKEPFYHCENQPGQVAMVKIVGFRNLIKAGYFAGSQR